MAVPKQVADANRRAEELIKASQETPEAKAAREAEEAKAAAIAAAEAEAAAASAGGETEEEKAAREAAEAAAASGGPAPGTGGGIDYEAQYNSLQGKYNNEVPILYSQIGELKIQIAELMAEKTKAAAAAPAAAATVPASLTYLRKEMPEFEDAVKYLVESRVADMLKEQIGEVSTKVGKLETTVVETAGTAFFKYLDDNAKNWRVINDLPDFLVWLKTVDVASGYSRYDLIQNAFSALDGARTAYFFNTYSAEVAASKNAPPAKKPIDRFAAPAGGGADAGAAAAAAGTEVTVTRADVQKFYSDVSRGIYKGDPEGMKKREAEINLAIAAGKVT